MNAICLQGLYIFSLILAGLLFCASELDLKEVYDWMVTCLAACSYAMIGYLLLLDD